MIITKHVPNTNTRGVNGFSGMFLGCFWDVPVEKKKRDFRGSMDFFAGAWLPEQKKRESAWISAWTMTTQQDQKGPQKVQKGPQKVQKEAEHDQKEAEHDQNQKEAFLVHRNAITL